MPRYANLNNLDLMFKANRGTLKKQIIILKIYMVLIYNFLPEHIDDAIQEFLFAQTAIKHSTFKMSEKISILKNTNSGTRCELKKDWQFTKLK